MKPAQLITWKGELVRRDYLIWGLLLFAVKYNLDRLTGIYFGKLWYITDYFVQADKLAVHELAKEDRLFYLVMLLQSIPFIWFGTMLCVKRLRNVKLPTWMVLFFFIPFVNFILFVVLCTLPERENPTGPKGTFLDRLISDSKIGSAMFSIGVVLVISLALTGLLINVLSEYGWSLFVGVPFFLGFASVLTYGYHRRLTYRQAMGVTFASILLFNLIIFILAFEGILCIVPIDKNLLTKAGRK